MIGYLLIIAVLFWLGWMIVDQRVVVVRELGRFTEDPNDVYAQLHERIDRWLAKIGLRVIKSNALKKKQGRYDQDITRKLNQAGLESASDVGYFFLIRFGSCIGIPLLASSGYLYLPRYYATVLMILCTMAAVFIPRLWLLAKIAKRNEEIQRELPLLIDLTNLGTSAGWDAAASLEKVVDALVPDFPDHPLMKEFRKGRWMATAGYTWQESLDRIGRRLNNDAVKRCCLALGQAMKQGGDRTSQLENIAEDAQRVYYSDLDRRLAGLPVKAILITMMLMIAYFMILMAPAAIQIKNVVIH